MPFVMVSGTVDRDKIETARGAGVTEFLAKPYSVSSLATRLLAVIDNPRQFVLVPEYFGPDRRRRRVDVDGPDRRTLSEEDVEVVYGEAAP